MTKKELIKSLKKKGKELSEKEQLYLDEEIKAFTIQTDDVDNILELLNNNIVSNTNANNILSLYLLGIAPYPEKLKHKYELADMLDIDLDFAPDGRDTIKQYLSETYGKENCVSIGTYGTLGVKGSVQEVSRVFNIPPSEYIKVSKAVSDDDKDLSVNEIKEKYPVVKKFLTNHPEVENSITKLTGMRKSIGCIAGDQLVNSNKMIKDIKENDKIKFLNKSDNIDFNDKANLIYSGNKECIKLNFDDGTSLTCTPEHLIYTKNRGHIKAQNLTDKDDIVGVKV